MKQIAELTGLRGIAAYSVLIAHSVDYAFAGRFHSCVLGLAYFGMSLFFVLSGFVIYYNYANVLKDGIARGAYRFFVARFARLYPLYIVMLTISLTIYPHEYFLGHPPAALAALTLTQSWFNVQGVSGSLFGQSWSISSEWFFYALFLFICIPVARIRSPATVLILFLFFCFIGLMFLFIQKTEVNGVIEPFIYSGLPISAPSWLWLTYFSPFLRCLEFVVGVLACRTYLAHKEKKISDSIGSFALLGCFLWICVAMIVSGFAQEGPLMDMLRTFAYAPALAPALILLCMITLPISRLITAAPVMIAGEISYSVYVLQFFVFVMVARSSYFTATTSGKTMFVFATMALITALAVVSYWLFEKPARYLTKKIMLYVPPAITLFFQWAWMTIRHNRKPHSN